MAISPDIAVGFPLAEHINARWIDRIHSQWVMNYARLALNSGAISERQKHLYTEYYGRELERVRRLIRDEAPEIILQANYPAALWLTDALLDGDPSLLEDYAPIAESAAVKVLKLKPLAKTPD
ncbi:MAG TPA: hypothetical protein PKB04_11720 [Phenylobacterium sp.]|nr:hypothetical protein [Phenylobacterium sp.]